MSDAALSPFFKSIIEQETSPIIICNTEHEIIYMNPAAALAEAAHGGYALLGESILDCHGPESAGRIIEVYSWFMEDRANNIVHTFYNEKKNKDVYMVALRGADGGLIGYYEKHLFRDRDTTGFYDM